jgi:hypothetical protein
MTIYTLSAPKPSSSLHISATRFSGKKWVDVTMLHLTSNGAAPWGAATAPTSQAREFYSRRDRFRFTTGAAPIHPEPRTMTATTIALLLALLLLPLLVLLWATESTEQRTKRLASYGWSQRRIADHLHITRYRVRVALAS